MTLHLRIMNGGTDHSKLEALLHSKFDHWTEDVHVYLNRQADGWVIVSAMATIGREGQDPTTGTSRVVMREVHAALKEAGEAIHSDSGL